jgi:cysteinyl-tRNA synthetase, unknown class
METLLLVVGVVVAGVLLALWQGKGRSNASADNDTPARHDRDTVPSPTNFSPADKPHDSGAEPMAKSRKSKAPSAPASAPPVAGPQGINRSTVGTGLFSTVRTWGYQLQKVNVKQVAASNFDLMVIDYAKDGSDETAFTPGDVQKMSIKPDGSKRHVIAYMSIGEAESYRYYWDASWADRKPTWLLDENPDWAGNFPVCYWDAGWQNTFCGNPGAYLDRIIAAGFDGVYLDKCDVFEDLKSRNPNVAATRQDLEADMVAFIARLSKYAKTRKPTFAVIMQNAEVLLEHDGLRRVIDGVAKESLLYGIGGPEKDNPEEEMAFASNELNLALNSGLTVFVVEYLNDDAKIRTATQTLDNLGYLSTIAPKNRNLGALNRDPLTV